MEIGMPATALPSRRVIGGLVRECKDTLMLSLLERNVAAIERRLVLVAPPAVPLHRFFRTVTIDRVERERLVRAMQRLRGSVYVDDGAV